MPRDESRPYLPRNHTSYRDEARRGNLPEEVMDAADQTTTSTTTTRISAPADHLFPGEQEAEEAKNQRKKPPRRKVEPKRDRYSVSTPASRRAAEANARSADNADPEQAQRFFRRARASKGSGLGRPGSDEATHRAALADSAQVRHQPRRARRAHPPRASAASCTERARRACRPVAPLSSTDGAGGRRCPRPHGE